MTSPDPNSRKRLSRWFAVIGTLLCLLVLNWAVASWMLWHRIDALTESLQRGQWPMEVGGRQITVEQQGDDAAAGKSYTVTLARDDSGCVIQVDIPGEKFGTIRFWQTGDSLQLESENFQQTFWADDAQPADIALAVSEAAKSLPKVSFAKRLLGSLALHPFITGLDWGENGPTWRVSTGYGSVWLGRDAVPLTADIEAGKWRVKLQQSEGLPAPETKPKADQVPGEELSTCIAETIRIAVSLAKPPVKRPDAIVHSGAGWMELSNGHAQMFLTGTPYEIGHQHGSLDPEGVKRVAYRTVYGVGLLYSFKQGEWFPTAARALVERQRPYIAPEYFEEMKGVADGAGLPLEMIQMANIFPEFFHCSGAALMGEATENGELLHARVLDYMVGIGLQEHAVVMAIDKPGANRFVTVGYTGFIGSISGMNEKEIAIGEMGGDGQGDWDGVPMALLIRQSLETCNSLAEVETLMRESPRTCEYYYLISDGKGPSALGVYATPTVFDTFGPNQWQKRMDTPIPDAVLLSGGSRYDALVERINSSYGKITYDDLVEIIKRPVAMNSNLHNVIFQPQSLQISVADATQGGLACDQPYRNYTWEKLFATSP